MCGEGAVTDRKCQKWFVKFHAGDFSLDDAPRSGGPVEVDSNQIETLIENNQCYTMQEIADILKISKPIKLLKMRNNNFIISKKKRQRASACPKIMSGLLIFHIYWKKILFFVF